MSPGGWRCCSRQKFARNFCFCFFVLLASAKGGWFLAAHFVPQEIDWPDTTPYIHTPRIKYMSRERKTQTPVIPLLGPFQSSMPIRVYGMVCISDSARRQTAVARVVFLINFPPPFLASAKQGCFFFRRVIYSFIIITRRRDTCIQGCVSLSMSIRG